MANTRESMVSQGGLFSNKNNSSDQMTSIQNAEKPLVIQMLLEEFESNKKSLHEEEETCMKIYNDFLDLPETKEILTLAKNATYPSIKNNFSLIESFDQQLIATMSLLRKYSLYLEASIYKNYLIGHYLKYPSTAENAKIEEKHPEVLLNQIILDLKFLPNEIKQHYKNKMNELNQEYREKLLQLEEKLNKVQRNHSLAVIEQPGQHHIPQPHFTVCNLL